MTGIVCTLSHLALKVSGRVAVLSIQDETDLIWGRHISNNSDARKDQISQTALGHFYLSFFNSVMMTKRGDCEHRVYFGIGHTFCVLSQTKMALPVFFCSRLDDGLLQHQELSPAGAEEADE